MNKYIWHVIAKSSKLFIFNEIKRISIKQKLKYIENYGLKNFIQQCLDCYLSKSNKAPENFLGITAIAKNESPYIKEWIEFHKLVGVEKFFIYNNDDNSDTLKTILAKYIESGEVEYKHIPGRFKQCQSYRDSIMCNRNKVAYMAFIDIDEFITPISYDSIPQFLLALEKKINHKFDAVGINWLMHGFNARAVKPDGLVIENYKRCSLDTNENKHIKSIVNLQSVITADNPHYCIHKLGSKIVNSKGDEIIGPFNTPPILEDIVVNHYWSKSYQEYSEKINRGRADIDTKRVILPFDPEYLSKDYDNSMDKFIPELKKLMEIN